MGTIISGATGAGIGAAGGPIYDVGESIYTYFSGANQNHNQNNIDNDSPGLARLRTG